ncbi:hypothetical protein DVH05_020124 [Phytophthora capsici]|nr:hypothetical protein DVH05_020124 [Phytophthora capsici]
METLSQEMLDSSYPGSETYSAEDEEMFWTVVHQGYSAKFDHPRKAGDAQTLRHQWEIIRSNVAEFDAILMEMWPNPVKHLDTLKPHDRKKILEQLKVLYQCRTGQCFDHMKAWKLLAHHSKWERVFRPLILRQQAGKATVARKPGNEIANYDEMKASIRSERPKSVSSTAGTKRRQTEFGGEDRAKKKNANGIADQDVAVVPSRIDLDQTRNTTNTLEWIRTMESKENPESPTRNVPAVDLQKPEKTKVLDLSGSLNDGGDATQRVSGVHLALAWANICCSCVDMSPRLEESHDWFWSLVSRIYFALAAASECHSDIEQSLRGVWREMRAQIATFHRLYEKELAGTSTTNRVDRESMVARALESYHARIGRWFNHRAAWEVLECHRDWDNILKPSLLRSNSEVYPPKRRREIERDTISDETKSDGSVDARCESSVGLEPDLHADQSCVLPLPPLVEKAAKRKSSSSTTEWLELNTRLLEMQIMTRAADGLNPEAREYLRLRRQQILQKTRLQANIRK